MTKISYKLLLGFGVFIIILITHSVLGQLTTTQASTMHDRITTNVEPAVALLNNTRTANSKLYLLIENKVVGSNNGTTSNRIKQIIEVDLPFYTSNITTLKNTLEPNDPRNTIIDSLVKNVAKSIQLIEKINATLLTAKDYEDPKKIAMIRKLLDNQLSLFSNKIDNEIFILLRSYNQELKDNVSKLSNTLQNNSNFFLLTSIFFVCFGIVITYRNTKAIVKPIKALTDSVQKIAEGNYEHRVVIHSKDELSILGTAFNQMSASLKSSFDQIHAKNKELEQFVFIASHDLQEPLRTISNFTEMLVKDPTNNFNETTTIYIDYISKATLRMRLLIKGLLDYSLLGGTKELLLVDCNEMVEDIKNDLNAMIVNENAKLEVGKLPEILAYKSEFLLLFQNLIHNAIKFHKPEIPPVVQIQAEEEMDYWRFEISDNGIGIKEHHKEKIFGIFQRLNTKNAFAGTGIGLAHCAKIIEMHKGTIQVISTIGHGSTFVIRISKNI